MEPLRSRPRAGGDNNKDSKLLYNLGQNQGSGALYCLVWQDGHVGQGAVPGVQNRPFLSWPFHKDFTKSGNGLCPTSTCPLHSLVNNARSLPIPHQHLQDSRLQQLQTPADPKTLTIMSASLPSSKEGASEKKKTADSTSLEGSFEHAEHTSLSDQSHSAPKVKWYRSTLYNALVLGLCNFLAPGLVGRLAFLCTRPSLTIAVITVGSKVEHSFRTASTHLTLLNRR